MKTIMSLGLKTAAYAAVLCVLVEAQPVFGVPSDASAALATTPEELQVERDKLKLEERKVVLTLLTILVTAGGVLATIAYNARNAKYQAQVQARLKALEVVTSAAGPKSAKERLAVVKKLLGSELIDQQLADDLVAHGVGQGHDQSRRELIKMLMEYPDNRNDVLLLWRIAFEGTNLEKNINKMQEALTSKSNGQTGQPDASSGQPASPSAR